MLPMPAPLSIDIKRRVVNAYEAGEGSYAVLAERFDIGPASVSRILRAHRERSDLSPQPHGGGMPPRITNEELPMLARLVAKKPDRTIEELAKAWTELTGVRISRSAMMRAVQRAGLTRKKKTLVASEQRRRTVQTRRRGFLTTVQRLPRRRLVFIDESGCNLAMTRRYGRSPRGRRVRFFRPARRGSNYSVVGAIRSSRVIGTATYKGAVNAPRFIDFMIRVVVPDLRRGDVVVMDNVQFHKHPAVKALIESKGATLLFLPPYSPELNPIESFWSKFKSLLRGLAARAENALLEGIKTVISKFRPSNLRGWFKLCGYP